MPSKAVTSAIQQNRAPDDYVYLLVDGLAECALEHPLSVPSLIESLGDVAITRVLRPDLSHSPEQCPALIQLARPGEEVPLRHLELSANYAEWDLVYPGRYICGWLLSPQPLDVIASHIVARCYTTADFDGHPSPWYEPLRLELLSAAMGNQVGGLLGPISAWLAPLSWGTCKLIRRVAQSYGAELPQLARETQQLAPDVQEFLSVWRHGLYLSLSFAPWRWNGPSVLPPEAGSHGFRLIRDARRLRLENSRDLMSLSLHRVFIHPLLPQHPQIQRAIAQAVTGDLDLEKHFASYRDNTWQCIYLDLPRVEKYS